MDITQVNFCELLNPTLFQRHFEYNKYVSREMTTFIIDFVFKSHNK